MTDPTAPKIDTTREAIAAILRQHLSGPTFVDPGIKVAHDTDLMLVSGMIADLAAAQTAAAVREMREALQRLVDNLDEGDFISITRIEEGRSALAATADGQAALDRLLEAARHDERTAIAAYIGMSPSEITDRQYHMEAIRTGRYRDDPLMQRGT